MRDRYREWDDRDEWDRDVRSRRRERRPPGSSVPGVLSFGLALVLGPVTIVLFVVAGMMAANSPTGAVNNNAPATMVLGMLLMLCMIVMVIGLVLGIVGLVMPANLKIFAVLGTIFNALMLLGMLALMIIGWLAG
jgi:hypothetical protein